MSSNLNLHKKSSSEKGERGGGGVRMRKGGERGLDCEGEGKGDRGEGRVK